MKNRINIEGIKLYAYHGCLEEEGEIGAEYQVDIYIETDFNVSSKTDELEDTVDYCVVYEIAKQQMAIRSKLIEHVCQRIFSQLIHLCSGIQNLKVRVTKFLPPMNGNVEKVSVEIES